jgi:hypothetical protein
MDGLASFEFAPIEPEHRASVFRVAVENVTPIWPQVEPLVVRALCGQPTHDAEDVRRMLLGNAAQLWIQWAERVEAICVSEFVAYPKGIWVRVWLVGADPVAKMTDAGFADAIEHWREANGCRGIEAIGRLGWLRRYPQVKFVGAVMRTVA